MNPNTKKLEYKKLKIIEDTSIVIEPILSPNINDDMDLSDTIFGLYSNDYLQDYFKTCKLELELTKNNTDPIELELLRNKIKLLDEEEDKIIYSSSDDEQQINIEV